MAGRYGRSRRPGLGVWLFLVAFTMLIAAWMTAATLPDRNVGLPPSVDAPPQRIVIRKSEVSEDGASFVSWFADGHDEARWYRSDFDNVDHFMQVGWKPEHVAFEDKALHLWLTNRPSETNPYTSAEYQKRGRYGFGRYEVVMKAARGSGLVTSFFTHTGPYFGDPHDEIDFEILGKDTSRVYLNWFKDGEEGAAKWHPLGFDAAESYHLYAFEWTPETIRWFVDGHLIHERPQGTLGVPVTPGRIIINLWTGLESQYDWHGEPTFSVADRASYQCISFRLLGEEQTGQCSDGWRVSTSE